MRIPKTASQQQEGRLERTREAQGAGPDLICSWRIGKSLNRYGQGLTLITFVFFKDHYSRAGEVARLECVFLHGCEDPTVESTRSSCSQIRVTGNVKHMCLSL